MNFEGTPLFYFFYMGSQAHDFPPHAPTVDNQQNSFGKLSTLLAPEIADAPQKS